MRTAYFLIAAFIISALARADHNHTPLNFDRPFTETTSNPNRCFRIFKVRPSLVNPRTAGAVLGYGRDREKLNRALTFLYDNRHAGQYRLVATWEVFAMQIIQLSGDGWSAVRFRGPNGEIGYVGSAGHAVVFKLDGRILMGILSRANFSTTEDGGNLWNGRGGLREFQPR